MKWFQKAADGGDVDAQYRLGVMHSKGDGVAKDDARAAEMFRKAALQGHINAQALLGASYGAGRGVKKDLEASYMWFDIASRKGSEKIGVTRDKMGQFLSPSRLQRARHRARICVATNYKQCD